MTNAEIMALICMIIFLSLLIICSTEIIYLYYFNSCEFALTKVKNDLIKNTNCNIPDSTIKFMLVSLKDFGITLQKIEFVYIENNLCIYKVKEKYYAFDNLKITEIADKSEIINYLITLSHESKMEINEQ